MDAQLMADLQLRAVEATEKQAAHATYQTILLLITGIVLTLVIHYSSKRLSELQYMRSTFDAWLQLLFDK
jgi:hypothetical protein